MKNFTPLLLIFFLLACKDNNLKPDDQTDLFEIVYSDFREVDLLKEYVKISDTSFVKSGYDPTHRVTHLEKDGKALILFSQIELDNERNEIYTILDTLEIANLDQNQVITIGYCETEDSLMEEIIAIVNRTDQQTIQKINKAWKANAQTRKIEPVNKLDDIFCFNEHF